MLRSPALSSRNAPQSPRDAGPSATLAHYVSSGRLPLFEHATDSRGTGTVFTIAVDRDAYWRLMSKTQDLRDALRRGRYYGVALSDRPVDLERYTGATASFLLDEHIVLGNMLSDGEPLFVWSRGSTTTRGRPIKIRRYAYVPEEFRRRAAEMGIVAPPPDVTRKRDQKRRGS